MRVTLMHNAGSGDEDHDREGLVAALSAAGHDVVYAPLDGDGWARALDAPADLVVVAGGDGTVRKVFVELSGRGVPVTVMPLGSANNIADTLGIPEADPAETARGWRAADLRRFDLPRVGVTPGPAGERFVESVGGGIFADLLVRAEADPRDPGGDEGVAHGLGLLADTIAEAVPRAWIVDLDGVDLSGDYLAVEAMNIRQVGPEIVLAPGADPGDGLLDLVLVRPEHRDDLHAVVDRRMRDGAGGGHPPPALPAVRGRTLTMRPPPGRPMHVDDVIRTAPADPGERVRARIGGERLTLLLSP